jgi:hypothetical protein
MAASRPRSLSTPPGSRHEIPSFSAVRFSLPHACCCRRRRWFTALCAERRDRSRKAEVCSHFQPSRRSDSNRRQRATQSVFCTALAKVGQPVGLPHASRRQARDFVRQLLPGIFRTTGIVGRQWMCRRSACLFLFRLGPTHGRDRKVACSGNVSWVQREPAAGAAYPCRRPGGSTLPFIVSRCGTSRS